MQQILKFKIEIFDVRMRSSINIINDTDLVKNIQITKNTALDNIATIVFAKSKAYELLPMETILKLYNYVKIEVELKNYNPSNLDSGGKGEMLYFSGFIQTINKQSQFGTAPASAVSITISDYANLLKNTFYTKNLTFLEILNQAVPEFRMINFSEFLGDSSNRLLNSFYSPTQIGFIFFAFLFFKFMYRIVYDEEGKTKKTAAPDNREIFKKFKIYLPFGLNLPSGDSMLKGQETMLTIYKQLQGVALDLFKYIYPEPIFEFSTFETEDSVILQIRLTPFMKFDRPVTPPISVSIGERTSDGYRDAGAGGSFAKGEIQSESYSFDLDSYNVIDYRDFGHSRIRSIRERLGISPAEFIRDAIDVGEDHGLLTMLQESIGEAKKMSIEDLLANDRESDLITEKFFNTITMDTKFIESINMTRSANSVVNVIWTVPTTDTAVLKMSGREIVYAYLQQRLQEAGGPDQFGNFIYQQFNKGIYSNPVFLMDYRGVYGKDFISGDMNYFGFREFEIKWNYLSVEYSAIDHILKYIDTAVLKAAKAISTDKANIQIIDDAIRATAEPIQQNNSKNKKPRQTIKAFETSPIISNYIPSDILVGGALAKYVPPMIYRQTSRVGYLPKPAKNKKPDITKALEDSEFIKACKRNNFDPKWMNDASKILELIRTAKERDTKLMGGFVSELNSVIASAYRENEHLYDCQITKPIDVKILPGMIVQSTNEDIKARSPRFKGYVTSVSHSIDFAGATMKTNINLSRTASDDSAVIPAFTGEFTP